ncbi:hypothetical protein E5676_scaffold203G00260 [Cucumis melo var. makuwa]|uniref:Uncharacterized protein n=1 Tax=Cucumis melo var. makuwa TaxID=1194695 RepID=A0A5D3BHZ1_CUCMM|nr:hypothetical protein E6C27_scaffold24G002950 [Cucumis melo var. makuwa]TYJ98281.1 hypothetical protein E5676_scaffold203G00260 [Cucumis melo var. makuwa]
MTLEHFSRESLRKWISNVVLQSDLGDDHIPSLHNLPYQVILPLYVFPSFMAARNFLSQTASFAASQAVTYSASIVESAMHPCLILRHTTAPPFRVNTDPDVDFLESLSVWKSELVYPVRIKSLAPYTSM